MSSKRKKMMMMTDSRMPSKGKQNKIEFNEAIEIVEDVEDVDDHQYPN